MGKALYRRYRPKSLEEVVGQEHITTTLKNSLTAKTISHAYLFTGPKGVGKTTVARIFAHLVNDLAYTDDSSHIDIIEIDAASNRGIDEIRDLREKVYTAPAELNFKVYIIDEVHMLTAYAFNALLKTLEEPPSHVIFILATTNAHSLPATIISRTQHFTFNPISPEIVEQQLSLIAKTEKIKIQASALKLLASHSDGSLRDSIGLLDQLQNQDNEITQDIILRVLGLPTDEAITQLINEVQSGSSPQLVMAKLRALYDSGYQAKDLSSIIVKRLKQDMINSQAIITKSYLELMKALIDVPASIDPSNLLEIELLKAWTEQSSQKLVIEQKPNTKTVSQPEAENTPKKTVEQPKKVNLDLAAEQSIDDLDQAIWQDLLKQVKASNNTLYGVLRMAKPSFSESTLHLDVPYAFYVKKIKESNNKRSIEAIISKLSGRPMTLSCSLSADAENTDNAQDIPKANGLTDNFSTINSIFNGAELLES